ncbi:unnamed protein product, partial [marine sediment metagenome]
LLKTKNTSANLESAILLQELEGVCKWVTGEVKPECVERLAKQVAEKVV